MPTSLARRQLSVYADPFSNATREPKIPDGKTHSSLGWKIQNVTDFTLGDDICDIILYPGIKSTTAVSSREVVIPGDPLAVPPIPDTTASEPFVLTTDSNQIVLDGSNNATGSQATLEQPDSTQLLTRWRMVSNGLKVTLLNNSEDDDGWFEAIRFVPSTDHQYYLASPQFGVWPNATFFNKAVGQSGESLVQHQTYMTGKLRDIHKYCFYNTRFNNEHHFKDLDKNWTGADFDIDPNQEADDLSDQLWDHNLDCVLIRIHGRKTPTGASACCKGTKLMLHAVSNVEAIYGNETVLQRLQTRGESYLSGINMVDARMAANSPPGKMPSAITYYNKFPAKSAPRRKKRPAKKYSKRT